MAENLNPSPVNLRQEPGVEHVARRSVLAYAPVVEQHEPVCVLCRKRQVVQRTEDGDTSIDAQCVHEIEDLLLVTDVKRGRGLVEEQHPWLLRDGASKHDALQFAAGQLRGVPRSEVEQVESCQSILNDPPILRPLSRRKAAEMGVAAERDVRADVDPLGNHRPLRYQRDDARDGTSPSPPRIEVVNPQ